MDEPQSVFRFLHFHTSCPKQVHKISYRVYSLQEFKQNESRTSCSSSNYCINFRVKGKEAKNKSRYEIVSQKKEKLWILWNFAGKTAGFFFFFFFQFHFSFILFLFYFLISIFFFNFVFFFRRFFSFHLSSFFELKPHEKHVAESWHNI